MSPSNTVFFPLFPSYPIHLDDDAWLALPVTIVTVLESRALLKNGAVELTGALWVVLHVTAVFLQEVLVWGAFMVFLGLEGVVIGCRGDIYIQFVKAYDSTAVRQPPTQ